MRSTARPRPSPRCRAPRPAEAARRGGRIVHRPASTRARARRAARPARDGHACDGGRVARHDRRPRPVQRATRRRGRRRGDPVRRRHRQQPALEDRGVRGRAALRAERPLAVAAARRAGRGGHRHRPCPAAGRGGSPLGPPWPSAAGLALDVAGTPGLALAPDARGDLITAGEPGSAIDARLLGVLAALLREHSVTVSVVETGHPQFTAGGQVSNHWHGRGIDIAAVDGVPVNAANAGANALARSLAELRCRSGRRRSARPGRSVQRASSRTHRCRTTSTSRSTSRGASGRTALRRESPPPLTAASTCPTRSTTA